MIVHRKILNAGCKSKRMNGYNENRIGSILGIQDRNNNWLKVGDEVIVLSEGLHGVILWNPDCKEYNICYSYSMWYGEDKYNPKSYGKSSPLRLDNGMKSNLELIE